MLYGREGKPPLSNNAPPLAGEDCPGLLIEDAQDADVSGLRIVLPPYEASISQSPLEHGQQPAADIAQVVRLAIGAISPSPTAPAWCSNPICQVRGDAARPPAAMRQGQSLGPNLRDVPAVIPPTLLKIASVGYLRRWSASVK